MSLDAYMVFLPGPDDPFPIEGESSDEVAKTVNLKPFEIVDFKWGVSSVVKESNKSTETGESGMSRGRGQREFTSAGIKSRSIHVDSFAVTKPFDSASLSLFRACATDDCKFAKAHVLFRKFGEDGEPYVFLKFEFVNVRVDKIDWKLGAVEGGDKPDQEDVDFSFDSCNVFYTPQGKKGEKMKAVKKTISYSHERGVSTS